MNDIIKSIDSRLKVLMAEAGRLHKAKELLGEAVEPVTGKTTAAPAPTPDKPMKAARKQRQIKKHRSKQGLLRGRLLTLLRIGRGTVKELVKQLEAAKFPFAHGTNHTGCVRAQVVTMKGKRGKGILTSTNIPGRGEVYSIVRGPYAKSGAKPVPKANRKFTAQARASQHGLTDRIIKVLAEAGVTGPGLTAMNIIRKMEGNGFRFSAKSPQKSVTGLLSSLFGKDMVSRVIPYNTHTYHYKIRTTTQLLDAVREED